MTEQRQEQESIWWERLLLLYKAVWIVVALGKAVPWLDWQISPYIRILLIPGALLILWDLLRFRRLWKWSLAGLAVFGILYGVTLLSVGGEGFSDGLKSLLYMALAVYLFAGYDRNRPPERVRWDMILLGRTFLAVTLVYSVLCLLTFFFGWNIMYGENGQVGYLGVWEGRLWGLYNANTGGALNAVSMLMLLFLLRGDPKGWKIFDGVSLFLHFLCLMLSGSRTSWYAFLIVLGVGFFRFFWETLPERFRGGLLRRFCLTAALLAVCFLLGRGLQAGVSPLAGSLAGMLPTVSGAGLETETETAEGTEAGMAGAGEGAPEPDTWAETGAEAEETAEPPVDRGGGLLTGRPILWRAGWDTFRESPLLGVSHEELIQRAESHLSDPSWTPDLQAGGLHNGYLTVLVSSGILGAAALLWWLVGFLGRTVRGLGFRNRRSTPAYAFCLLFLGLMGIMELFESRIFYQVNIFMVLFWMVCGYAEYWAERREED